MTDSKRLALSGFALGFRVKSGWAAGVLIQVADGRPVLLHSRRVELADPATPRTYQPYHAAQGTAETDERKIEQLTSLIERTAARTIAGFVDECRSLAPKVRTAAIVRASATDPAKIGNPHVRIHALEGQLFPRVADRSLVTSGIAVTPMLEADLWARAERGLLLEPAALKECLTRLGRGATGGWRAEQKTAALAAWTLVVDRTVGALGSIPR